MGRYFVESWQEMDLNNIEEVEEIVMGPVRERERKKKREMEEIMYRYVTMKSGP